MAAGFALASLLLAGGASWLGVALHQRDLIGEVDRQLTVRLDELQRHLSVTGIDSLRDPAGLGVPSGFGQVVDAAGQPVSSSSPAVEGTTVIDRLEARRVLEAGGETFVTQRVPGVADKARLLARASDVAGRHVVIVVGSSLDASDQTRQRFERLLAGAVPAIAALLGFGAWWLLGAALRPVTEMAERADAMSIRGEHASLTGRRGGAELSSLAAHLDAMVERLRAGVARERAFIDAVSHEVKTPLAAAKLRLELANTSLDLESEASADVTASLAALSDLSELVERLLVLARAESGAPLANRVRVSLSQLVAAAVERLEPLQGQLLVRVSGHAEVDVDPELLERAVENLLTNAYRYAATQVTVALTAEGRYVVIAVSDDGPGVPEELRGRVFERFARDPSDDRSHTGLGLALVAAVVAAHGGSVALVDGGGEAANAAGSPRTAARSQGATFLLRIPTTQ